MDRREFADPGPAYGGVTLWMLNDRLEPEEVSRQLRGFRAAGWGAVIARTFVGLRTRYLSDEWMQIIGRIIAEARQEGLKVWLQAGFMPSGIPDLAPEWQHRVLNRLPRDEPAPAGATLLCQDGSYAYYRQTLEHTLDLLKAAAVQDYLRQAYEVPWWSRFAAEFGETIETVWVDEPHLRPPFLPWSDGLPAEFERRWGYPILAHLPSLYAQTGDWQQVRHHYWRVVLDLFLEGYFRPVGRWCAEHRVKFGGHLMGEDTINAQIAWTAAAMPCYEHMQLPGIDHLTMSLTWPSGLPFYLTPKQAASVANQMGRKEVLAEMYGVSSQRLSFAERKMIANWMALLGITYRCYHGSFYSLRGVRKRIYVPHISYQQPWWPHNRRVADYFARVSYALRQGSYQADVLALHPVESGFCLYDPTFEKAPHDRVNEPPALRALTESLSLLSENLLAAHRGFDYGDESLLARHGRVHGATLVVGEMGYRVVVLPSLVTLRRSTVDLLQRFMAAGGPVLAVGELPSRIDGVASGEIADFCRRVRRVANTAEALQAELDRLVPPGIAITAGELAAAREVWVHERALEGERAFFIVNTARERGVTARIRVRGSGRLEEWDLETGHVSPMPQRADGEHLETSLTLAPLASHLLVLRQGVRAADRPARVRTVSRAYELSGPYRVRRRSPNALTLDFCRCRRGDGPWTEPLPVLALQEALEQEGYRGPVTLEFRFRAQARPQAIQAVVEDAQEYEMRVNGQPVRYQGLPYYWDRSFHPVDITPHVRLGENVIELARAFEPPARAAFALQRLFHTHSGVELESIYLIGDFAVQGALSGRPARERCVRLGSEFVLTREPQTCDGDLVAAGYPFFAGSIGLEETVTLPAPRRGERVSLLLPHLDAALATVRVNGQEAGAILWPPYRLDVTDRIREGANAIEIEFVTSLRNLLGPHHREQGEPDDTWAAAFAGHTSRSDGYAGRGDRGEGWTDDYFVLALGLRGKVVIEYAR